MKVFTKAAIGLKQIFVLCFLAMLAVLCTACSNPMLNMHGKERISIVSYNAQTFFDSVEDGTEFKEFKGTKTKWSKEKYAERLSRLKEAVSLACVQLGFKSDDIPDILVLQEIESRTVVEDFCKQLPFRNSYKEAVFIQPVHGSAFSTAVLSKFPITDTSVFEVYHKTAKLRPLVETRIKISDDDDGGELALLNVHWKSKVGTLDSEEIRDLQERHVYERLKKLQSEEPNLPFIVCGDFNQTLSEFSLLTEFDNCWNLSEYIEAVKRGSQKAGSYFFKGEWEGIDHFFYSDTLSDGKYYDVSFYSVIGQEPLIDKNGIPYKYSVFSGKGYSDHLPVGMVLERQLQ